MAIERTFAMIKPDAVQRGLVGRIVSRIETQGFRIVAMQLRHLSTREAEGFYAVHRERPFFKDLVRYMTSGPTVTLVLERDNAIKAWRDLMGVTDPAKAAEGTIRRDFGKNIEANATHGSDAPETAAVETAFFFGASEFLDYRREDIK